jgi:aminoglycoside phosphotransferase (APT) family kinase protein
VDTAALGRVWDEALAAPVWDGPGVWVHGDLAPGNLLTEGGRVSAVIDFGGLGVGDPAVDLLIAWTLFDAERREGFRDAVGADDATWARGRGWTVSTAVGVLSYYLHTNPPMVATARRAIAAVLAG